MGVGAFAADMSEDGLFICQFQHFRDFDVSLVPLKDKEAARLQYSKALSETLTQDILPSMSWQPAVLHHLPVLGLLL